MAKLKKAISPIIGIVIIVAITLGIGVFSASWIQGVARTQTEAAGVVGVGCPYVFLEAKDATWDNYTLSFRLINTGTANVTINDVRIIYADGTTTFASRDQTGLPTVILGGDAIVIRITNTTANTSVGGGISYARILTTCASANIEIARNKITFAPATKLWDSYGDFSPGSTQNSSVVNGNVTLEQFLYNLTIEQGTYSSLTYEVLDAFVDINDRAGQTFTATFTNLTNASFMLYQDFMEYDANVSFWTVNATGYPNQTIALSGTISNASIPTWPGSEGEVNLTTLSGTATFNRGSNYSIVLQLDPAEPNVPLLDIYANDSNPYPGGHVAFYDNSAGTWTINTGRDLYFKLYGSRVDYYASGQYNSSVFDAGATADWDTISWSATTNSPTTDLTIETRAGNSSTPDGDWSSWQGATNGGAIPSPNARYIQWRANFTSADVLQTPILHWLRIEYAFIG